MCQCFCLILGCKGKDKAPSNFQGQQCAYEKSNKLGQRKGLGIAGNPECVGVDTLVGGVQC